MVEFFFLVILLVAVNSVALAVFGLDKLQSKRDGLMVSELQLLVVAFFRPFGAYAGMFGVSA